MPNLISKIQLPGGTYFVKDAEARKAIAALSSATHFLGVTTTTLEDGATTSVVVIDGKDHTAVNGDIVIYGGKEFIYNASAWAEFGDLSALKDLLGDLAYHDIEDIVVTVTTTKNSVLGADTTFTAAASQVSFAPGTGSDFVTGYSNDAEPPSLGNATKASFAVNGVIAFMDSEDSEMLVISTATTAQAVTEQGTLNPGKAATLAVAKAITASDTATAAAQGITVGDNDLVDAVTGDSASIAYKNA